MRRPYFMSAFALCGFLVSPAAHALDSAAKVCPAPQPAAATVPTFASDFTKARELDPSQWRAFAGQHGGTDSELELYIPQEAFVVPGAGLRLQTDKFTVLGHPYVSGEVTTQGLFSQTYGHFEMMAKMPEANGMWPAFWLLPENNSWPPEIDVVEYIYANFGQKPAANAQAANAWASSYPVATLHAPGNFMASYNNNTTIAPFTTYQDWNTRPAPAGWSSAYAGYHIYAIDWRPNALTYLIDNVPVLCVSDAANAATKHVPDMPMYMIMNDAVTAGTKTNPGWPGYIEPTQKFPVAMDIAYVHVSQFKDLAGSAPMLPLDIVDVTVANGKELPAPYTTVKAGGSITVNMHLQAGAYDLGAAQTVAVSLKSPDMTQYNGMSWNNIARQAATIKGLKAHQLYPFSLTYTVPANLAPGIYSLVAAASYGGTVPVNGAGAGQYISESQAALLNVVR